jgi:CO/xanthine dehydrogenase FAD-binding subunit
MKPPPFDYEAPRELGEALELLHRRGEDGKVLAGGQSLVPLLNFRLARPEIIIDVNRVEELAYLRRESGRLRIGALTRQSQAEHSPVVREHWPILVEALRWVAHPQIRNRGTIGGSVAHADPSAELPVVLTALDARAHVRSMRGTRTLTCDELFTGPLETSLAEDELLCELEVPPLPERAGWSFQEFARRHGDFALGGAAVVVGADGEHRVTSAAICMLGAGPTPLRAHAAEQALAGRRIDEAVAGEAAEIAVAGISPTGDIHGSGEYRRDLIQALVRRAVLTAATRANGGPQ